MHRFYLRLKKHLVLKAFRKWLKARRAHGKHNAGLSRFLAKHAKHLNKISPSNLKALLAKRFSKMANQGAKALTKVAASVDQE